MDGPTCEATTSRATASLAVTATATAALLTAPAIAAPAAQAAPVTHAAPAAPGSPAQPAPAAYKPRHALTRAEAHKAHLAHVAHVKHLARLAYAGRHRAASDPPPRATRHRRGTVTVQAASYSSPRSIAAAMLGAYGWGQGQMSCLIPLWMRESGWNPHAENPGSGAYGIPQALPGSKMASAGADWRTNPATQIRWGLAYIAGRYGSPCGAWAHSEADGWY